MPKSGIFPRACVALDAAPPEVRALRPALSLKPVAHGFVMKSDTEW